MHVKKDNEFVNYCWVLFEKDSDGGSMPTRDQNNVALPLFGNSLLSRPRRLLFPTG